MADIYSRSIGATPTGVSIDDIRRVFNFGERVAELNPAASPFFAYLSKVANVFFPNPSIRPSEGIAILHIDRILQKYI